MDRFFSIYGKGRRFIYFEYPMSDLLHPDRDSGGIDHSDVLCDHKDGKERRVLHNQELF